MEKKSHLSFLAQVSMHRVLPASENYYLKNTYMGGLMWGITPKLIDS